jgi:peptide/nickel transport system permease protein
MCDGGEVEHQEQIELFTKTAEVSQPSRSEQLKRIFDSYVFTPVAIGWNDWRTRTGAFILFLYVIMGTVGVLLTPAPTPLDYEPSLQPFHDRWLSIGSATLFGLTVPWPDLYAPLGTQITGMSLLGLIVHATPAMFKMITAGALFSAGLGTFIGTVSGYKGGKIDTILMSLTDIILVIPALALVIVIASIYPPKNPFIVGIILGIDNWPGLARNIRSQVLSIREESYVEAHRTMNMPDSHILRKDIITQMMPYISINFANGARRIIFESVALYFLGILPFSNQNWGVILNTAYGKISLTNVSQLYWLFEPMIVIIILTIGLVMFAQGLDQVFNVRLQARHAKTKGGGEDEAEEPVVE